jgi:hypothetical protein
MSLTVVNGVSSTSPDSGYSCGGKKIRIMKFLLKKLIFQLVSTTKHPTNTFKTPRNQLINLINPKERDQTTKLNQGKYFLSI